MVLGELFISSSKSYCLCRKPVGLAGTLLLNTMGSVRKVISYCNIYNKMIQYNPYCNMKWGSCQYWQCQDWFLPLPIASPFRTEDKWNEAPI